MYSASGKGKNRYFAGCDKMFSGALFARRLDMSRESIAKDESKGM
jgi:hypothetical protein